MPLSVVVRTARVETEQFNDWDAACGQAVRESLNGAHDVILVDTNGSQYNVYAEPAEDNS